MRRKTVGGLATLVLAGSLAGCADQVRYSGPLEVTIDGEKTTVHVTERKEFLTGAPIRHMVYPDGTEITLNHCYGTMSPVHTEGFLVRPDGTGFRLNNREARSFCHAIAKAWREENEAYREERDETLEKYMPQ